jgi:hypothetical protein
MDDLERRILALEHQARHERELTEWKLDALCRRLQVLEASPLRISAPALLKIMIAIFLPASVLLLTGDLRKALAALRMAATGG